MRMSLYFHATQEESQVSPEAKERASSTSQQPTGGVEVGGDRPSLSLTAQTRRCAMGTFLPLGFLKVQACGGDLDRWRERECLQRAPKCPSSQKARSLK